MVKVGIILAASAAALSAATLGRAQEPSEEYLSVPGRTGPWYLQSSTCTLAHNEGDRGTRVVWFRLSMGAEIEFADRDLRGVRDGEATLTLAVDGQAQPVHTAQGVVYEDARGGYRLFGPPEWLDAVATGRRLEVRRAGRPVLQLDLPGAGPAVAALRDCWNEAAATAPDESNVLNAM